MKRKIVLFTLLAFIIGCAGMQVALKISARHVGKILMKEHPAVAETASEVAVELIAFIGHGPDGEGITDAKLKEMFLKLIDRFLVAIDVDDPTIEQGIRDIADMIKIDAPENVAISEEHVTTVLTIMDAFVQGVELGK